MQPQTSPSHILIVDDDELIRAFLRSVFTRQGYEVVDATNGNEALASARENPPCIIISDVLMPVMDGYQLCMEWHKDEKLRDIPFVFYSGTFLDEEDEKFGRSLGAADFITRPIELNSFMERIEAVLKQHAVAQTETISINHSHEANLKAYSASLVKKLEHKMEELKAAKEKIERDFQRQKETEKQLRESEERYRTLVETQLEAICRWKLDTTLTFVNAAYCRMLGKTREELIGRKWIEFVPEETRRDVLDTYETAALGKQPVMYEHEVETPRGRRWYLWQDVPICDPSGSTIEFQSMGHDITDRKKAEEKLQQLSENLQKLVDERTREIQKAHQELESFVYTVTHDLRAPIRHVSGFLQFLRNELGENVNEKAARFMDVIEESAKHMTSLIDGFLDFARLGKIDMQFERVDMHKLVSEVLEDFKIDVSRYNISFNCGELHVVEVDRSLIRTVLVNLIGNAIKFSSTKGNPKIEIACKPSETEHIISIRDNGIGFDMRYADKLFGIFQRLHGEKEFTGTGIGLASVKQIVSRHGGRVWAEGEVGKGACFYFTLPKKRIIPSDTLSYLTPEHQREENCHE